MNENAFKQVLEEVWGGKLEDVGISMEIGYNLERNSYRLLLVSDGHSTVSDLYHDVLQTRNVGEISHTIHVFVNEAIEGHIQSRPTKEVPLFTESVIGYRRWRLADWVLAPLNHGNPWRPGVNKAVCQPDTYHSIGNLNYYGDKAPTHDAPAMGCNCGMNAFFRPQYQDGGNVAGAIIGWGNLQVHPDGFRSEYARIVALLGNGRDYLNDVAKLYVVPLVDTMEELQVEASKHGSPLPESLRPPEQEQGLDSGVLGSYLKAYNNALKHYHPNPYSYGVQYKTPTAVEKARRKHKAVPNPMKKPWKTGPSQ